jgi:hypothetical protein
MELLDSSTLMKYVYVPVLQTAVWIKNTLCPDEIPSSHPCDELDILDGNVCMKNGTHVEIPQRILDTVKRGDKLREIVGKIPGCYEITKIELVSINMICDGEYFTREYKIDTDPECMI